MWSRAQFTPMGEQRPQIQRPTSAPKPTNAFLTKPNCPWNPICPLAERLRLRLDVFAINVTQQDVTSRRMRHLSMPGQASPSCESSHVLHDRGLAKRSSQWCLCCSCCAHATMIVTTPFWSEVSTCEHGHMKGPRLSQSAEPRTPPMSSQD